MTPLIIFTQTNIHYFVNLRRYIVEVTKRSFVIFPLTLNFCYFNNKLFVSKLTKLMMLVCVNN